MRSGSGRSIFHWTIFHIIMGIKNPLRISPFEALYGCIRNTSINCSDPLNKVMIELGMIVEVE